MKKTIVIILTLVIVFVFSACGGITKFKCSAVVKIHSNFSTTDSLIKFIESNTAITKIAENLDFEISNKKLRRSIEYNEIDRIFGTVEIIVSYKDEDKAKQILNVLLEQCPVILNEYSQGSNFTVVSKSISDS